MQKVLEVLYTVLILAFLFSPLWFLKAMWDDYDNAMFKTRNPPVKDRADMTDQERWEDMSEAERMVECHRIRMQVRLEVAREMAGWDKEDDVLDAEFEIIDRKSEPHA